FVRIGGQHHRLHAQAFPLAFLLQGRQHRFQHRVVPAVAKPVITGNRYADSGRLPLHRLQLLAALFAAVSQTAMYTSATPADRSAAYSTRSAEMASGEWMWANVSTGDRMPIVPAAASASIHPPAFSRYRRNR